LITFPTVDAIRRLTRPTRSDANGALLEGRPEAQLSAAICLMVLGVGGRYLLSGLANFETLMVTAFLAVMLLPTGRAMALILSVYWASNWVMGYEHMLWKIGGIYLFTYSGFLMVGLATWLLRRRANRDLSRFDGRSVLAVTGYGLLFTAIFDTWTNFGVFWFWFAHTPGNLLLVFTLGLPFAIMHIYSSVLTFTLVGLPAWLTAQHLCGRPASRDQDATVPRSQRPRFTLSRFFGSFTIITTTPKGGK